MRSYSSSQAGHSVQSYPWHYVHTSVRVLRSLSSSCTDVLPRLMALAVSCALVFLPVHGFAARDLSSASLGWSNQGTFILNSGDSKALSTTTSNNYFFYSNDSTELLFDINGNFTSSLSQSNLFVNNASAASNGSLTYSEYGIPILSIGTGGTFTITDTAERYGMVFADILHIAETSVSTTNSAGAVQVGKYEEDKTYNNNYYMTFGGTLNVAGDFVVGDVDYIYENLDALTTDYVDPTGKNSIAREIAANSLIMNGVSSTTDPINENYNDNTLYNPFLNITGDITVRDGRELNINLAGDSYYYGGDWTNPYSVYFSNLNVSGTDSTTDDTSYFSIIGDSERVASDRSDVHSTGAINISDGGKVYLEGVTYYFSLENGLGLTIATENKDINISGSGSELYAGAHTDFISSWTSDKNFNVTDGATLIFDDTARVARSGAYVANADGTVSQYNHFKDININGEGSSLITTKYDSANGNTSYIAIAGSLNITDGAYAEFMGNKIVMGDYSTVQGDSIVKDVVVSGAGSYLTRLSDLKTA